MVSSAAQYRYADFDADFDNMGTDGNCRRFSIHCDAINKRSPMLSRKSILLIDLTVEYKGWKREQCTSIKVVCMYVRMSSDCQWSTCWQESLAK